MCGSSLAAREGAGGGSVQVFSQYTVVRFVLFCCWVLREAASMLRLRAWESVAALRTYTGEEGCRRVCGC